IMSVAKATAEGIRQVAEAINLAGGRDAMQLRLAEEYIKQFGLLAKSGTSMIVPATVSDVSSMIAMATSILKQPAVVERKLSQRVGVWSLFRASSRDQRNRPAVSTLGA